MRGLEDIIRQNREVAALGGKVGDLVLPVSPIGTGKKEVKGGTDGVGGDKAKL